MNSSIPLKKCCSCREKLPYDQFGELTSSKDGFNPTCKPCRATISARHHQNSLLGFPNRIIPKLSLKDHNISTLESVIAGDYTGSFSFGGGGVNDILVYNMSLVFDETSVSFEILDLEGELVSSIKARLAFGWTSIRTSIVNLLFDLEIKLYEKEN